MVVISNRVNMKTPLVANLAWTRGDSGDQSTPRRRRRRRFFRRSSPDRISWSNLRYQSVFICSTCVASTGDASSTSVLE